MIKFDATKLAAVAIAQSNEETRYYLKGVYFEGDIAVATDGNILTASQDTESVNDAPGIYPISKKAHAAMKKRGALCVVIQDDVLTVLDDQERTTHMEPCKPIDGTFPDWKRLIPKEIGAPNEAAFSAIVMGKLVSTAVTLSGNKAATFRITGITGNAQNVSYAQNDTISVAMPYRNDIAPNLPVWALAEVSKAA